MSEKVYVVFHGPGCLDGMAAAAVAWHALPASAVFIVGRYQEALPEFEPNSLICLLDFSYPRAVVEGLLAKGHLVVILDHHKSAFEDLAGLSHEHLDMRFNMSKSGAMLAWEYFRPNTPPPDLIRHIQDRDLWLFKDGCTKPITTALFAIPGLSYKNILDTDVHSLYEKGRILLAAHDKEMEVLMKISRVPLTLKLPDKTYELIAVNCSPKYASDIGNAMAKEQEFGVTYYDTFSGREYSLRSIGDFDVSYIARFYGGGGHKNAAGFKIQLPRPEVLSYDDVLLA
jgi:uncharacterized protein